MSVEPVAGAWFRNGRGFLAYGWRRFMEDRCPSVAAALSYTTLLGLVPLAAIVFGVLAAVPLFDGARESINSFVFENFVPDTGAQIAATFDGFVDNAGELKILGIAALVIPAFMLLATIETTFNRVFRVVRHRRLPSRLVVYFVVLTLGPVALGVSVSLATNVAAVMNWAGMGGQSGLPWRLDWLSPALLIVVSFSVLYTVAPNREIMWRDAFAGGLCAGLLFSGLRWALGLYLENFPIYQTIYGALSAVPVFLIWMYLSWAAVLIGAVITAALSEWQHMTVADRE
jgi:membrane protein